MYIVCVYYYYLSKKSYAVLVFFLIIVSHVDGGHDSTEDSIACMELMIWKVKQDLQRGTRRESQS